MDDEYVSGVGVRHVVYWSLGADAGSQSLKVNLIVYDNDILQVSVNQPSPQSSLVLKGYWN